MWNKIRNLPVALQKQILIRMGIGFGFFILFLILLIGYRDKFLYLPCMVFAGFFIVNAVLLLYNSLIRGGYIAVQGICERIEKTGIRRHVKSLTMVLEEGKLKIPVRQRVRNLSVGDTVIVYLSDKTPVYKQDGMYLISSYYALEIRNGV